MMLLEGHTSSVGKKDVSRTRGGGSRGYMDYVSMCLLVLRAVRTILPPRVSCTVLLKVQLLSGGRRLHAKIG